MSTSNQLRSTSNPLRRVALTVESGPCEGRKAVIAGPQATLGRDPSCSLALAEDTTVSRQHALLAWEGGEWVLRDLGSKNGTVLLTAEGPRPLTGPEALPSVARFMAGSAVIALEALPETLERAVSTLRIVREGEQLMLEHTSAAAVVARASVSFHAVEVEALRVALHATVARALASGEGRSEFEAALRRMLGLLVPESLKERLRAEADTALSLHLGPDLLEIPWECLDVDGVPMAAARPVTRQILLESPPTGRANRGRRVLLVANPTGDLPATQHAAEELLHWLIQEHGLLHTVLLAGPRAASARVAEALEQHDAVLYIGHAAHGGAASGWQLSDGPLGAARVSALVRVPALVIAGACESARETGAGGGFQLDPGTAGMASAALLAGVEQYAGSLWPVPVVSGTAFGAVLLQGLVEGRPAGEAVLRARQAVLPQPGGGWITAAGFIHYGRASWHL